MGCDTSRVRWLAGVAAAVIVVALSILFLTFEVCEEQLATAGDDPGPVEVCRSLEVTDPLVVGAGVVLLALAGVFFNEVSGFGFTLKREVREAKAAAQTARDEASATRDAVATLQAVMSTQISSLQANQSLAFNPTFNLAAAETKPPTVTVTIPDLSMASSQSDALERIRAQDAYDKSGLGQAHVVSRDRPSRGVRVAIVGVSPGVLVMGFPAFRGQIDQPYIARGAEVEADHPIGAAELGHVLAMEPEARIYPIIVTNRNAVADARSIRDGLVAALRWEPAVILLGVAGGPGDRDIDQLLRRASGSTFVVVGAGNNGRAGAEWPGSLPDVTSVAFLDRTGQLAAASNHGPGVDLAAPGDDVLSLVRIGEENQPEVGRISGSSVSAGLVAGLAGMLLARTNLESQDVADLLVATATADHAVRVVDPMRALAQATAG